MKRAEILAAIGTMKSELYVLDKEAEEIEKEIEEQYMMKTKNIIATALSMYHLGRYERELRLHDLVTFCNTGRYPE